MDYLTGASCAVCGKSFQGKDDIVICPECGTPYHRSCYQAEGKCIFSEEHAEGFAWEPPARKNSPEAVVKENVKVCKLCGHKNEAGLFFCARCGASLLEQEQPQGEPGIFGQGNGMFQDIFALGGNPYYGGFEADDEINGVKAKDLAAFVGSNAPIYMQKFYRMETSKKKTSFNFASFFFGSFWTAYRKMIGATLLILLINMFIRIPDYILLLSEYNLLSFTLSAQAEGYLYLLTSILQFGAFFLIGVFADRIYLWHCTKKIKKIQEKEVVLQPDYTEKLKSKGGVSWIPPVIIMACQFVLNLIPYVL